MAALAAAAADEVAPHMAGGRLAECKWFNAGRGAFTLAAGFVWYSNRKQQPPSCRERHEIMCCQRLWWTWHSAR